MKKTNAIFNAMGSRLRNGPCARKPIPKAYGFVADMRLRLNAAHKTFQRAGGIEFIAGWWRDAKQYRRSVKLSREFYTNGREIRVTYYGTPVVMTICHPYVVAQNSDGNVIAIFPIHESRVLIDRWARA